MSVTKDGKTGKWMSQIRVKDWTGKEIHKKKRGFPTKKEALQWERDYISQATGCQRRCDFVIFRRTGNVGKWRVNKYSL